MSGIRWDREHGVSRESAAKVEVRGTSHPPPRAFALMHRPTLLGECPGGGQTIDGQGALGGRTGQRLCRLTGLPDYDALRSVFDLVNIWPEHLDVWPGDKKCVKRTKRVLTSMNAPVLVGLGARVRSALRSAGEPVPGGWFQAWSSETLAYGVVIPHPSGLSRVWNEPGTSEQATWALEMARTYARGLEDGPRSHERDTERAKMAGYPQTAGWSTSNRDPGASGSLR